MRQLVSNLEHENMLLKRLGEVQEQQIKQYTEQITIYRRQAKELRSELRKKTTFWEKTGHFVLGAAVTSIIGYGTVKALK